MSLLARRRVMMGAKSEQGLPGEYQQVEWIGHAKTKSIWIKIPNPNIQGAIKKVIMDIAIPSTTSDNPVIWGGVASNGYGSTPYGDMQGTLGNVTCSPKKSQVSDISVRTTYTFNVPSYSAPQNCYCVWGWDGSSFTTSIRGYSVTFYGANDAVMFRGIPCYRKSDNAIGLYNTVSKVFLPGLGTWTKGADVA